MKSSAKVIFLEQLENVRSELERGLTLRAVLKNNSALEGIKYPNFCNYVRAYITSNNSPSSSPLIEDAFFSDDEPEESEPDYISHSIIVPRMFRRLFRFHAANADMSEYEFLRMLVDKYEAEL